MAPGGRDTVVPSRAGKRARRLAAPCLIAPIVAATLVSPSHAADADVGSVQDAWSSEVTVRTTEGGYASAVHSTLMPDGSLLMFGFRWDQWPPVAGDEALGYSYRLDPTPPQAQLPQSLVPPELSQPVARPLSIDGTSVSGDDLICSGHTLLSDGRLLTVGGTRSRSTDGGVTFAVDGLPTQTVYDGSSWTRVNTMVAKASAGTADRWYPTAIRLPDRRVLIASGFDRVAPTPSAHVSTEVHNPATRRNTVASKYLSTPPEILNSDYTHGWVLPYRNARWDLLMVGELGVPVFNRTARLSQWKLSYGSKRPGAASPSQATNNGTSSTMLPLRVDAGEWGYSNGSVLMASGTMGTDFVRRVDVYDPLKNTWRAPILMPTPRHHPNTVVLPDGRVLVLGGHTAAGSENLQRALYIDPADGFRLSVGSTAMGTIRGYHATAALLPDGRVLLSGGRDADTKTSKEKPTFQYYEPDYMTKPRPTIVDAPAVLELGQASFVSSVGPRPAEAVLVSLASHTHSFDQNQRVVELPLALLGGASDTGFLTLVASPNDGHVTPPGPYMLFLLDENRVPSVARMVTVT